MKQFMTSHIISNKHIVILKKIIIVKRGKSGTNSTNVALISKIEVV